MTIDERIEALTNSLELFERHTRERFAQHERELDDVKQRQKLIEENMIVQGTLVARVEVRMDQLAERMDQLAQNVNRFIRAQGDGHNGGEGR
jgi:hypothetical protein